MRYILQFAVIMGFTLAGELPHLIVPLPVPAAVWGIVLLFIALQSGAVKLSALEQAGDFLTGMLPVLFVAPAVGLMACWDAVAGQIVPMLLIVVVSTVVTFAVSGRVTQAMMRRRKESGDA